MDAICMHIYIPFLRVKLLVERLLPAIPVARLCTEVLGQN